MPIIVNCTGCGRKLRLADEHAGKTARCPVCRMTFQVPADAVRVSDSAAAASGAMPPSSSDDSLGLGANQASPSYTFAPKPPEERWFMRTPEGQEYGPVGKVELDGWVREGRIAADCFIRRDGTPQWINPRDVYPQIAPAPAGMAPGAGAVPRGPTVAGNPYAAPPGMPGNPYASAPGAAMNPYASPTAYPMPGQMPGYGYPFRKAHRGGLLIALSVISWFVCPIVGLVSLIMAYQDLTEMDQGLMDESGRGLTRAAQIIAGIQWSLVGLYILGVIVFVIANL